MNDEPERGRREPKPLIERGLGVPGLFVAAYSAVGFSIYFALGVVADRGLGLTPLIFLAAGLLFVVTTLSYLEGGAMLRERGGSSSFARHAFNEVVAFIAGWAILIDYLIVAALAAISVPHYLAPVTGDFSKPGWEIGIAAAVIVAACVLNALNITGRGRERRLALLALADVALQLTVIVVGVLVVLHPERLTENLDLFTDPSAVDVVYASVVAMLAYAGIEAASDLAPDIDVHPRDLKRVVSVGALAVPLVYAGMAAVALMAVPVVAGPDGPQTALGSEFVEAPILGVVSAYPSGVADAMRWVVTLIAVPVLFWAVTTAMLGVSRHIYTLAINRQIPSWLGKLSSRHGTPQVAIAITGVIAIGLVVPTNVKLLAGIYAFGATLAITIAQLSILRLRVTEPDRPRPFRVPWDVSWGTARLPVPALFAAVLSGLAFLSVLVFHDTARWVGGGWMVFGLLFYVVYRKVFEGTSLTKRVSVSERSLTKQVPELSYRRILVPIFGTRLDDDIVSTAGRLAAAEQEEAGGDAPGAAHLDLVYVIEVPLQLALDAELPAELEEEARRALERAADVGDEYADVEVSTEVIRARKVGAGIVEAASRLDAEAIVVGAEPPSRIRGGARLGGIGAAKPEEIGAATEYVLMKAPCRVLLTAPPEAAADPKPEPAAAD